MRRHLITTNRIAAHVVALDCRMAVVTQERHLFFQQTSILRTVRRMAVGAIFTHRLMFPQERAALLGMAVVANFRHAHFFEQLRSGGTVRIVAIRADHFTLANRVMRKLIAVRTLFGVTLEARVGLSLLGQHRIRGSVKGMAIHASDIVALVLASLPVHAQAVFVAAHADFVDDFGRRLVLTLEDNRGQGALAVVAVRRTHVFRAGAVTRFAIVLRERGPRIAFNSVCRSKDIHRRTFIVTTHARIGTPGCIGRFTASATL